MDTHTSRIRRIANAVGLLTGGLMLASLTACGAGGSGSEDDPSATPTTAVPSESSTPTGEETTVPDISPSLEPSFEDSSKPGSASQTTITGTIASGVESGCLILEYDGTVYGIYGSFDSSIVYAGAEVTLHGVVDTGMMTTCQQGTPFVVSEAETAS